jgi:hypothetical protein
MVGTPGLWCAERVVFLFCGEPGSPGSDYVGQTLSSSETSGETAGVPGCRDPESARTVRYALQMAISTLRYEENRKVREPDSRRQPLASSRKSNKRYILR